MTTHRTDPLLLAGKVLTLLMQAASAFGAVVLMLLLPVFLLAPADFLGGFAEGSQAPVEGLPVGTLGALLFIGLGVVAAMFVFFGKLRAIIDTVGDGDPFIPENARRLNIMAWLLLGVQLATIPALILATKLAAAAGQLDAIKLSVANDGLDISGILVVLILFILARVFRIGAALREDLEGTV